MKGSRSKAVFLLASAFALGVLSGAGGMAVAERRTPMPRGGRGTAAYLERLAGTLDLSSVQRDSVRAVLDRHAPAMEAIFNEVRPRMDTVRQAVRAEVRQHLTEAQLMKYEEMLRHDDAERNRQAGGARAGR